MEPTTRRRLLTQGGRAAVAALALQGALGAVARAQQLVPGSPTLDTATPGADSPDYDLVAQHLALFDRLDFESWNTRDWELFRQLHSDDVHVEGFGTTTDGIDAHLAWAQATVASTVGRALAGSTTRAGHTVTVSAARTEHAPSTPRASPSRPAPRRPAPIA